MNIVQYSFNELAFFPTLRILCCHILMKQPSVILTLYLADCYVAF